MSEPNKVVTAGLNFLRAITEQYGGTVGVDVFETMKQALPDKLADDIFAATLIGIRDEVTVRDNDVVRTRFIETVRHIRHVTGMGLSDAKDFCDAVLDRGQCSFRVESNNYYDVVDYLCRQGLNIH